MNLKYHYIIYSTIILTTYINIINAICKTNHNYKHIKKKKEDYLYDFFLYKLVITNNYD